MILSDGHIRRSMNVKATIQTQDVKLGDIYLTSKNMARVIDSQHLPLIESDICRCVYMAAVLWSQ
jgi:hypothetical protein